MDPRGAGASTVELGSTSRPQLVCSGSTPLRMHGLRCCASPGHLSWPLARPAWMTARCASRGWYDHKRQILSDPFGRCDEPLRLVMMAIDAGIRPTSSCCSGRQTCQPTRARLPHSRRKAMNVAIYARVSTPRQQQAQTIDQQLERLHAHVAGQPDWHLADEHIYRDDGYSG